MNIEKSNLDNICHHLNIIIDYLSIRDISTLTKESIKKKIGIDSVDVMIVFGGIISGAYDLIGEAYKRGICKKLLISGGDGHTTQHLRDEINSRIANFSSPNQSEASIIASYLKQFYDIDECYLESESTNCGNNITYTLELLKKLEIPFQNVILIQDTTMMRRMDATLKMHNSNINTILFSPYIVHLKVHINDLVYLESPLVGMWEVNHYISLIMGEIQRLYDDEFGYGPNGKGYIAHVEIPEKVLNAYNYLKVHYQPRDAKE